MSQGYLYLVTCCVCIRNQAPDRPVVVGSSSHDFRRVFDVNTGLQCRFQGYLYLLTFILPTSDPIHPFAGMVSSGLHQKLWITLFLRLTFKDYPHMLSFSCWDILGGKVFPGQIIPHTIKNRISTPYCLIPGIRARAGKNLKRT